MTKITLKSIKRDNVRAVLEAIVHQKHITKQEITTQTGLSLVTVGKITNLLGEAGVLVHGKNAQQKIGRRAEVLRIRQDWAIPVYDLSSNIFRFYITALDGRIIDKAEFMRSANEQYVSSDFVNFLKLTVYLLRQNYRKHKLLGIGISIPGTYDAERDRIVSTMMPEMGDLKLMHNIRNIFKKGNIVIDNANRLCSAGLIESLSDYREKTITCISFGNSIECTTCDHGTYLRGAHDLAGRLGDLPYVSGVTYTNFIYNALSTSVILEPVLELIRMAAIAYDPEELYICSSRFSFTPDEVRRMQNRLAASVGIGACTPNLHAAYNPELEAMGGIISRVIENWLDDIIERSAPESITEVPENIHT